MIQYLNVLLAENNISNGKWLVLNFGNKTKSVDKRKYENVFQIISES